MLTTKHVVCLILCVSHKKNKGNPHPTHKHTHTHQEIEK